jgi:kynurenine formamidase
LTGGGQAATLGDKEPAMLRLPSRLSPSRLGLAVAVCAWPALAAAELPSGRIVDLSHPYDAQTIFWPTEAGFSLQREFAGKTEKGYYYSSNKFCTPEHGGTHIDAPVHFAEGHLSVDQLPLERLMGHAVVVDVSAPSAKNPDYEISIDDFTRWEKQHGQIPKGAIVLLRTGFAKRWPDRKRYLGTDERGPAAVAKLHFPGLHPAAARWLVDERAIKAVGLDTASIDHGQSTLYETHRALFDHDVPAFENLDRLDELPPTGLTVIALPMKIAGGTGGPLRIIAFVGR